MNVIFKQILEKHLKPKIDKIFEDQGFDSSASFLQNMISVKVILHGKVLEILGLDPEISNYIVSEVKDKVSQNSINFDLNVHRGWQKSDPRYEPYSQNFE
ncbi:hypothetical protein RF11_02764 [Thelohanellus kitauei]|uniref:Uncharacterized protein n=1 Tax=Thelohanellus kitauei TaxID=669202 RepID=A0A0C2IJ15_THEKT|nr:hypothetical protein RF11_02764 [Thelohanellus kitauei]